MRVEPLERQCERLPQLVVGLGAAGPLSHARLLLRVVVPHRLEPVQRVEGGVLRREVHLESMRV